MDNQEFWTHLSETCVTIGLRLLGAILVLIIGIKLSKKLVKIIAKGKKFNTLDKGIQSFIKSALAIVCNILVIVTAAYIMGIPMTSFIAILASAAAAIGLALQGSLSNFAGGIMLLIFKPFKVGDMIEACGHTGYVTSITVFYTYIKTIDGEQVTLPNGNMTNNAIKNMGPEGLRRVDVAFSVSYNADIDKVKQILLDVAKAHPFTLAEPEPFARMLKQNSSSMDFELRVWGKIENYWTMYCDLNEEGKKALDANGIEIPYPQMDIHIK